jgi:hypothetical protein
VENTLFIGFNPGFGSGYDKLLLSWTLDLVMLINMQYRVFFSQANDFSDLRGENRVFEKLFGNKVNFIVSPVENPFRSVTIYSGEGSKD